MKIKIAEENEIFEIQKFFERHLDRKNKAIYSEEFFCPFGISANIKRRQMLVIFDDDKVVGALRFYPRKKDKIISIYQFAIDENYRGKNLMNKMLEFLGYKEYEVLCPVNIDFN